MSEFSDEMALVAEELITEFGEAGSFERTVQGTYDPGSADILFDTVTNYSGFVAPMDYKDFEIDGTIILKGDFRVLAHDMDEVPSVGDELTFNSKTCRIINVSATRVNGASVLYSLQCRI